MERIARRRQRRAQRGADTADVADVDGETLAAWRRPGATGNANNDALDLAAALAEARRQVGSAPPDDASSGPPLGDASSGPPLGDRKDMDGVESNGVSVPVEVVQRAENARRLVVGVHQAMKDQGVSRWVYPLPTNVQSWLAGKVAEQSTDVPQRLPVYVLRHVNGHPEGVRPFKQHARLLLCIAADVRKHARGLAPAPARGHARSTVTGKQGTTVDDVLNEVERVHDTLQQRADAIERMRQRIGDIGISRRDAALGLGAVGALGAGAVGAALLRRWRQQHL